MQDIAKQTGGEYYYGNSALGLTTILGWIQNETIDKIDPTDIDGDGLYDIYETAGMRLPNGRVIYTNPSKRDTDGDALSDFQETGLIFCVDDRYIGFNKKMRVKYFLLRSNPTKKDSDNDGIKDADDRFPWKADSITIELKNKFSNCDYLNIVDPDGTRLNGGNQGWWKSNDPSPSEKKWDIFKKDINHRIHKMGCGVVAMTDLEIYLTQQNAGYDFLPSSSSVRYNEATGEINYDTYKKCIENNSELRYRLGDPINFVSGVTPMDMKNSLSKYLRNNNSIHKNVQWAPYWLEDAKMQSIHVEGKIEEMLKKDLPVVFAYNTFSRSNDDKIKLYLELEDAIEEKGYCDTYKSHYMTIIGVTKCIKENGTGYDCFLKVVSCGKMYYIRYDDYSMHMDYFCNILSID